MQGTLNAGSWRVAVEALRAVPDLELFETHPGGGLYDCLTLVGDGVRLEINREGSIHILASPRGEASPLFDSEVWPQRVSEPGGARQIACELLTAAGLPWPDRRPPTTPRVLTYRVIARLLAAHALDEPEWDVRSQFLDTSGHGGSWISEPVPSAEMALLPANRVWRVLRGQHTTAWLCDGWAWTAGGERRDLMAAYDTGATLDQLVGIVTAAPPRRRAAPLPVLPDLPRQPTGWDSQ